MVKRNASLCITDFEGLNSVRNHFGTAGAAALPKAGTIRMLLSSLIQGLAWRRNGRAGILPGAIPMALVIVALASAQAAGEIIAHWDFNEAGGDVARSSVGGQLGQLYGGASFVTEGGVEGGALSLERDVNSYVDTGPWFDFVSRDFSLQAWVRTIPGDTSDLFVIGQHNSGSLNGIILFVNGINPVERRNGSAGFYASARQQNVLLSGIDVNDGNWHQLVSVYRMTGMVELYVDGANLESSAPAQSINPNTASFIIGGINYGQAAAGVFDGLIDDVQVYDHALAADEIQYLYENPGLALGESQIPGDTDNDGDVDLDDLNNVRNTFGATGDQVGDANDDGVVDLDDLNAVRNNFGTARAAAVPEPGALAISVVLASTMLARRRIVLMLCAFVAFTVCDRSQSMAATFHFLPPYPAEESWTVPTSVTNQGDVILGDAYSRAQRAWGTFAWSDAQGIGSPAELGLPTGSMYVSADGGHIAGAELHLGAPEQFLWSPASGKQFLGNLPGTSFARVTGISEQAATVVGWNIIDGVMAPTIWTSTSGIRLLNTSHGVGGVAFSVSDDGKVVVGKVDSFRQQAARWTSVDTCELIPDLPEAVHSWAADTSDDGSRVVGYMGTASGETAFLWEEGIGTKSLFGDQSNWIGSATAMSGDGLLIGGSYSSPSIQKSAFVWSEATGMRRLHDLVEELGYDLGEWRLDELTDISRNGRFVTGAASGPGGYRGFLIDLHSSLTGDTDNDGDVDLDDLNNVRNTFGQSGDTAGDANGDGVVNLDDLNDVRNNFGATAGAAAVPEPNSLSLIVFGCTMVGIWVIARRTSLDTLARAS